ncbi:MAG: hypothetical protein ACRDG8_05745 [Actinomycetota bacterium]
MSTAKMALIAVAGVAAGLLFTVLAVAGDERAVFVTLALYVGGIALVTLYRKFSRRSAVEREARRLGLSFSRRDPFRVLDADFHPFLRFGKLPGTQRVENVVWGVRDGREVRAFDYRRPAEDEIRYSCAMVRIPDGWPSLLVRRHGPLDVARNAAGLQRIEFELDEFNRRFEVRSDDRRLATAVIDQRMIGWLLESDPALGFQLQEGWLLAWMPQLPPDELERTLTTVEGFHERIPRAVWSLYGDGSPARPDLG